MASEQLGESLDDEDLSPEERQLVRMSHALQQDESCQGIVGVALRGALEKQGADGIFTADQIHRIMHSFGSDVAATAQEHALAVPGTTIPAADGNTAAQLQGRLDYCNQYGDKWRISITDAEITPARKIPQAGREGKESIKIPRLELLVFNDCDS